MKKITAIFFVLALLSLNAWADDAADQTVTDPAKMTRWQRDAFQTRN